MEKLQKAIDTENVLSAKEMRLILEVFYNKLDEYSSDGEEDEEKSRILQRNVKSIGSN